MLDVKVEETVNATAAALWDLASDFGGIQRWSPGIASCTVDGSGVGTVRTLSLNGLTIRERLEQFDAAARRYSYSILEAPLPLQNYLATVQIDDAPGGGARIVWSSTFESNGVPDDQAKQMVEMIYRQGISGLKKALGA